MLSSFIQFISLKFSSQAQTKFISCYGRVHMNALSDTACEKAWKAAFTHTDTLGQRRWLHMISHTCPLCFQTGLGGRTSSGFSTSSLAVMNSCSHWPTRLRSERNPWLCCLSFLSAPAHSKANIVFIFVRLARAIKKTVLVHQQISESSPRCCYSFTTILSLPPVAPQPIY